MAQKEEKVDKKEYFRVYKEGDKKHTPKIYVKLYNSEEEAKKDQNTRLEKQIYKFIEV